MHAFLSKRRPLHRDDSDNDNDGGRGEILGAVSNPYYLVSQPNPRCIVDDENALRLEAFRNAWQVFEQDAVASLRRLRAEETRKVVEAVHKGMQNENLNDGMTAVMLLTGVAGASGDRTEVFSSVLEYLRARGKKLRVVKLVSEKCGSMTSVCEQVFQNCARPVQNRHLVLGLEDAELFEERVLRDLVYVCNRRLARRQVKSVAFVFGLATEADPILTALGVREASMIAPVTFSMPSSAEVLESFVATVLSPRRHALMLSSHAFSILQKDYLDLDSSASLIMRFMKHVYAEHFWTQPVVSIFFSSEMMRDIGSKSERNQYLRTQLTAERLDHLRKLKSVNRLGRNWEDGQLFDFVNSQWESIEIWRKMAFIAEKVLLAAARICLLNPPAFLRLVIFSASCDMQTPLEESKIAQKVFARVPALYRRQICELLNTVQSEIAHDSYLEEMYAAELESILKGVNSLNYADAAEDSGPGSKYAKKLIASGGAAAKCRRLALLQQNLEASKRKDALQPFRIRTLTVLKRLVSIAEPLRNLPMHEIVCFADEYLSDVQHAMGCSSGVAQPRAAFWNAMRHPGKYLGRDAPTPDTCTAYTQLAEGSRLVNLYDWYQSFSEVRCVTRPDNYMEGDSETQARFMRACAELERIGTFKKTNRRTDHVARLLYE